MNIASRSALAAIVSGAGGRLDYLGYHYRRQSMSAADLSAVFPRAEAFELMLQRERAGAAS